VTGIKPEQFNTPALVTVVSVQAGQVIVTNPGSDPPAPQPTFASGGMITGTNLDTCPLTGDAFTVALTVTAAPLSRGYLYLRRNAFFDDSVNFSVGTDGMLSESDTQSTQEITAILTELAQTAGAVLGAGGSNPLKADAVASDDDKKAIDQLKKDNPQEASDFLGKLSTADLTRIMKEMQPDDLTVVLKKLPPTNRGLLLKKLAAVDLAKVMDKFQPADAFGVLVDLLPPDLSDLLRKWPPADLTAFARTLAFGRLTELLQKLMPLDRDAVLSNIKDEIVQEEQRKLDPQARSVCFKAVADTVKTVPIYDTAAFDELGNEILDNDDKADKPEKPKLEFTRRGRPYRFVSGRPTLADSTVAWEIPISTADASNRDAVSIRFTLKTRIDSYHQVARSSSSFGGFVAFFPVPTTARNECVVTRTIDFLPAGTTTVTSSFLLSPQTVVNLYTESHFLNPQRDFFTNPHDTFTFTAGMITGHKFTGQSAAKTLVDTITQPIRSLMPSVTVTQTVAVSPTGKTTTTATQTAPPK
jgi:hypothetical protein